MREKTISINGNNYKLTALDASVVHELQETFISQAPCPISELVEESKALPESLRDDYIRSNLPAAKALKESRKSLNSPEFQEWLKGKGSMILCAKMFRKHHSNLSELEAFDLAATALAEQGDTVFDGLFPRNLSSTNAKA